MCTRLPLVDVFFVHVSVCLPRTFERVCHINSSLSTLSPSPLSLSHLYIRRLRDFIFHPYFFAFLKSKSLNRHPAITLNLNGTMSASEPLHDVVADNDPLQVHTAPSSIPAAGEPKDPDKPDVSNVDGQPVESVQSKWYHRLNPLRLQKIPPVPTERSTTPEYGASFLSVITFEWMSPLMRTGYLRPLVLQDIWTVSPDRKVDTLSDKLEAALKKRMASGTKNALFWALHDTFKFEFYIGGGCQLLSSLLLVFNPYLTRYLIEFATTAYVAKQTGQPAPHIGKGMGMVIGMTCMQQLGSFCSNQFMYRGHLVGGQVRAVLISHIFDKSMKLSSRAKAGCPAESTATNCQETTQDITPMTEEKDQAEKSNADAGESCGWSDSRITTLMSIDVERINSACGLFHMIWTAPISIIVILVLLVVNIGYSCLAGFALVLIGIPCLGIAMRSLAKIREKANMITDQRVCLTQEIIRDVRFVKYFGWESSFLGRLKEIRANEIRIIRGFFTLRNVIFAVTVSIPVFVPMLSFITYFLTKHTLNPSLVFSSVALFNSLRVPLNFLPTVISQATDARTALSRIQGFLFAEERKEDIEWDDKLEAAVEVEHASFTWERVPREAKKAEKPASCNETKSKPILNENPTIDVIPMDSLKLSDTALGIEPFKLNNITFRAGRNELLAVIGTVGCGKSSLLSALAGDMRLTDGTVRLSTTRSFCPQYAWVQNTSVRNNILFGKEYDETWYNEVIDACALTPDFKILPNGDLTEIGERGITVSGGQKQRMNIARAIYSNAELVLMDDPLSAVDAHVGRHIMDKAICGLLKGRCRILATHQVHVLGRCHRIIVMDEGRICAVDTFDNLMRDNETFRRLVSTSRQDIQEEENSQTDKVAHDGADNQTDFKKAMSAEPAAALMQEEEKATASVSWNVWKAYIQATGSFLNTLIIAILLSFNSGSSILTNLWLSFWSSDRYPNLSNEQYIGIYVGLGGIVSVLMFTYSNYVSTCGTNASKHMFQQAMSRVLRAPMGFFDTTPLGRITNRFSKDSQVMDNELAEAIRMLGITIGLILSVMILATVFYYYVNILSLSVSRLFLIGYLLTYLVCHCDGSVDHRFHSLHRLSQSIRPRVDTLRSNLTVNSLCQVR